MVRYGNKPSYLPMQLNSELKHPVHRQPQALARAIGNKSQALDGRHSPLNTRLIGSMPMKRMNRFMEHKMEE